MGINPLDPEVARQIHFKAKQIVGDFGISESDLEDIEQDLRLHLLEKAEQLVAHTASQKTVIDVALRNAIHNLVAARTAKKRDDRRNIDLDIAPESSRSEDDPDLLAADAYMDVREAMESLDEELRPIALHLMHFTPTETQREFGLTRGKLRQCMKRIAEHFGRWGLSPDDNQSDDSSGQ